MMSAPPGLPSVPSSWPLALSNTSVGDIEERGRLPGSTRLAIGLPLASVGAKLKSVSSLLSKKPLTMRRAPKPASMVVVMATALPCASTMLMWLVPYSGWSGMGAYDTF